MTARKGHPVEEEGPAANLLLLPHSPVMIQVLLPNHVPCCPGSPPEGPLLMELGSNCEGHVGQSQPVGPSAASVRRNMAGLGGQIGAAGRSECPHPNSLPWAPSVL